MAPPEAGESTGGPRVGSLLAPGIFRRGGTRGIPRDVAPRRPGPRRARAREEGLADRAPRRGARADRAARPEARRDRAPDGCAREEARVVRALGPVRGRAAPREGP